jgi:ribonuclease HII
VLLGGIDEVGRGPLAGPVVAACVVADAPLMIAALNDSKLLSSQKRADLDARIRDRVVAVAVGEASVEEIDRLNIYWASILAMERAVAALEIAPQFLFLDAVRLRRVEIPQEPIVKGDARCAVVAAASIVAKVHRDRLMTELDGRFPEYGFAAHKGYSTRRHLDALRRHGPCVLHRRSWAAVREAPTLFDEIALVAD